MCAATTGAATGSTCTAAGGKGVSGLRGCAETRCVGCVLSMLALGAAVCPPSSCLAPARLKLAHTPTPNPAAYGEGSFGVRDGFVTTIHITVGSAQEPWQWQPCALCKYACAQLRLAGFALHTLPPLQAGRAALPLCPHPCMQLTPTRGLRACVGLLLPPCRSDGRVRRERSTAAADVHTRAPVRPPPQRSSRPCAGREPGRACAP